MKVEKLQLIDAQKKQLIEVLDPNRSLSLCQPQGARGRRESAVQEVNKARAAMELHNLPLMGSLLSKK